MRRLRLLLCSYPNADAEVSPNFNISPDKSSKTTPTLETVSDKSEAGAMVEAIKAAPAAPAAAPANSTPFPIVDKPLTIFFR